jgi:hypothetical protein
MEIWEKTWAKWEEMSAVVVRRASVVAQHVHGPAPFTQESQVAFVDVIKCVRSISRTFELFFECRRGDWTAINVLGSSTI